MGILSDISNGLIASTGVGLRRGIYKAETRRPFRHSDKNLNTNGNFLNRLAGNAYSFLKTFEPVAHKWHARPIQAGLSTQIVIQATDTRQQKHTVGAIQTMTPTETRPMQRLSEIGNDTVVQTIPNGVFTVDIAVNRLVFDYQRLPAAFARGFRHIHAQRLPFDIVVLDYNAYREFMIPEEAKVLGGKASSWLRNTLPLGNKLGRAIEVGKDIVTFDDHDTITVKEGKGKGAPSEEVLDIGSEGVPVLEFVETRFVNCWLVNYSYTYDQANYLIAENATVWAEMVQDVNTPRPRSPYESDVVEGNYNDDIARMRGVSTPILK